MSPQDNGCFLVLLLVCFACFCILCASLRPGRRSWWWCHHISEDATMIDRLVEPSPSKEGVELPAECPHSSTHTLPRQSVLRPLTVVPRSGFGRVTRVNSIFSSLGVLVLCFWGGAFCVTCTLFRQYVVLHSDIMGHTDAVNG